MPMRRQILPLALAALAALASSPGRAEESLTLRGSTFDSQPFDLVSQRGKVVLVFVWRTDCAVCLSKLPELRMNAAGWRDKPFEVVLLNADRQRGDAADYERAQLLVFPGAKRHPSLWRGEPGHVDSLPATPGRLPLSLLLDPQGRVVARFEGRIPPEAWDRIAGLLP